jgi:colanic acid biosynthesis glycosyl transferase WcaI
MKVLFLNRFFHPDISPTSQILSDLAFHLAGEHPVHVITSRLKYDDAGADLPPREVVRRVVVHRVWTSRFGRGSLAGRTADYITFYLSATLRLLSLVHSNDIVVPMTDPPLISVPASAAARLKGAKVVNWLQDIFPEVAGELDFKRIAGIGRALARIRDRSLASASCNVVLGELMAVRMAEKTVASERIRIIPNWASGDEITPLARDDNPLRREWGLETKFVVGYSGNMGRAHEFAALFDAADRLRHRQDIAFLLIGGGKQRPQLEEQARARQLDNVTFRPYQPREILPRSLTVPDCHIVSLRPSLEGLIVPSKLYSSMAAGRPVIFVGAQDGEISRLMQSSPAFGISVAADDVNGLVNAIEDLAGDRDRSSALGRTGRRLFEQEFDRPIALAKWSALIAELCPGA